MNNLNDKDKMPKFLRKLRNKWVHQVFAAEPKIEIANLQGIGKREEQQDSFFVSDFTDAKLYMEKGFFAVVADGMGGMENGAQMSAMITSMAREYFTDAQMSVLATEEEECAYLEHFLELIYEQSQKIQREGEEGASGSTIVAVWMKGDRMYFLSVGDSRICLYRDGNLYQMNREHNLRSKLSEAMACGDITKDEYEDISGKSGLTSYIGMPQISSVDMSKRAFKLKNDDVLLLMSDGVFGTISGEELAAICECETETEIAKRIRAGIEERDKRNQDNYTGVIIRYRS